MRPQSPEEAERERAEDERNAGCFLRGLGCAFDAGIPFVLAFIWLLT